MPSEPPATEGRPPAVPSMLDLVRLSPRLLFPPGGVDLYRQIALLTDMGEGDEVLDVAAGRGVPLDYFVREYGVNGSGVEADSRLVEEAEERTREAGLSGRLQFQAGSAASLPYRDEIFDVTVGELGLSAHCDPAQAVRELVRVTKPGGLVVLVQLVWKATVDESRQAILVEHLGARPLMLVEWKRLLKEAGVADLHSEDWSDDETSFRARGVKPFPDFAEIFSLAEKIGILRRAWARWGWTGVRSVLEREREIHRLLSRERVLGLNLLKGQKLPVAEAKPGGGSTDDPSGDVEPVPGAGGEDAAGPGPAHDERPTEPGPDTAPRVGGEETVGLPLFDDDTEPERPSS